MDSRNFEVEKCRIFNTGMQQRPRSRIVSRIKSIDYERVSGGGFVAHRGLSEIYAIQDEQYESGYSFICEFAGLVDHQRFVYILHQFLLVNSGDALMSSVAFGGGLAGLAGTAA